MTVPALALAITLADTTPVVIVPKEVPLKPPSSVQFRSKVAGGLELQRGRQQGTGA